MGYPCERFVIKKSSDKTGYVYLADRNKTRRKWWTTRFNEAMIFCSEIAAEKQKDKLKYGHVYVEKLREAWEL
jgi:hypothetical protein